MKIKLINYSKFCSDNDDKEKNLLDLIAYCARVSNPANQNNTETNEKLIHYLIKNKHWSPFEMVSICIEIETTRDIIRQILRHRSFSFQEFSQRYAVADLGFECKEARLQDSKNRQNSISIPTSTIQSERKDLKQEWLDKQDKVLELVQESYDWALSNGIAKEQARAVLPEGMTLSRIYMNGTLRSWIHYIQLRSENGTQKEHRDVAVACAALIDEIFPISKILELNKN
jgi:thymidylate synthase (FAD)